MRIALIGCGNMGEAVLAGIHKQHKVLVIEPRAERQKELSRKYRCSIGPLDLAVRQAEVVVLAIKPQDIPELLAEMRRFDLSKKLLVSIAAGITTAFIGKALGQKVRVVRVMPNLPAMIGEGMSGITGGKCAEVGDVKKVEALFAAIGGTVIVKEAMIDAVTAVSGSGPAYVFLFAECLMKAARKLGFKENEARTLVYRTLLGSAHMLSQSSDSAEVLRQKVTSKGGTTQAATDVFMRNDIVGMFDKALRAAKGRAKELSR